MSKKPPCQRCRGEKKVTCPTCNGKGEVGSGKIKVACPKTIACTRCGGTGVEP